MSSWFLTDEELGKKDDDHKFTNKPILRPGAWSPAPRIPPRKTFKRLLIFAAVAAAVYLFFKNMPTDVSFRDRRRPVYTHGEKPGAFKRPGGANPVKLRPPPAGSAVGAAPGKDGGHEKDIESGAGDHTSKNKQPGEAESEEEETESMTTPRKGTSTASSASKKAKPTTGEMAEPEPEPEPSDSGNSKELYNGPLRFLNLSTSLYQISEHRGVPEGYRNVLFTAASLKSVGSLLPLACEMAAESRSSVHFALMGRSTIDIGDLLDVNGVDNSCPIIFHDARPDFASISTDERIELAATRALHQIEIYTQPRVIVIDGTNTEDVSFTTGIVSQATKTETNIIQLPRGAAQRLPYLAKLDSNALNAWNQVSFDILIHASAGTSGSLIRLLKSLSAADFTAVSVPHLTVELAHDVDESTEMFLQQFRWPPNGVANPTNVRQLSIRRRVVTTAMNEEDSSVRTMESFWPHNGNAHVLVLSPQAELAPGFLQYCKYALLEYAYSNMETLQQPNKRLFGLSLELPKSGLDGKVFTPPLTTDSPHTLKSKSKSKPETGIPFLWQAPNSNAMLILGNRWVELHGFVSRLLEAQHLMPTPLPHLLTEKLVSKQFPSWLELALRLCRARGYWTVYPSAQTAGALATIHSERYIAPEEYAKDQKALEREKGNMLLSSALFETLPEGGQLPPFAELPTLIWEGGQTTVENADRAAQAYAEEFRTTVGGCKPALKVEEGAKEYIAPHKSAKDLFCKR